MTKKKNGTKNTNTRKGAQQNSTLIDLRGERVSLSIVLISFVIMVFAFIGMKVTIVSFDNFLSSYPYGATLFVSIMMLPGAAYISYLFTRINLINRINLLEEKFHFFKDARDEAINFLAKISNLTKITSKERSQIHKMVSKSYEAGRKEGVKVKDKGSTEAPSMQEIFGNSPGGKYANLDVDSFENDQQDNDWMG